MTPRRAEDLLRSLMRDGELRDAILGDLTEGWSDRATCGVSRANRWYWRQAIGSVPSLLVLWCRNAGVRSVLGMVLLALGVRVLMVVLQYVAIGLAAFFGPGPSSTAMTLAAVIGCVGSAALCGWLMRRVGGGAPGVAIIALCVTCVVVQVDVPLVVQSAMPTWMYWLAASPLSAISVVLGAMLTARPASARETLTH